MTTDDVMDEALTYGFGVEIDGSFDDAIEAVTAALKQEGFGVLTTIDVQQTLKTKLDVETAPYVILGACNPVLAHRALTIEPELGLLLPCNVIVHQPDQRIKITAVDPMQMLGMSGNDQLRAIAIEANARLRRSIESLRSEFNPS